MRWQICSFRPSSESAGAGKAEKAVDKPPGIVYDVFTTSGKEEAAAQRHKTNILLRLERNRSAAGEAKGRAEKRGGRQMKTSGISSESGERNKIT